MADDEDIAALVVDNGSGMCKGEGTTNEPTNVLDWKPSTPKITQPRHIDDGSLPNDKLFAHGVLVKVLVIVSTKKIANDSTTDKTFSHVI